MNEAKQFGIAVIGAGRIGQIHADNFHDHPNANVRLIVDPFEENARRTADRLGANWSMDIEAAFANSSIDAVVICSPTPTHADLLEKAANSGKAAFCEKPIDLDIERVAACERVIDGSDIVVQLGFNRRFDPGHAAIRDEVASGRIGRLQQVIITSRDPSPPPASYVTASGGIFRDMTIHDFDMARFVTGDEVLEVSAQGSCIVTPEIGEAGDHDTIVANLKMRSGAMVTILNSRNCAFGYDQRIEAFGEKGMAQSNNVHNSHATFTTDSFVDAKPPLLAFFQDRYAAAYKLEVDHFIDCLQSKQTPSCAFKDGKAALIIADAATQSAMTGKVVEL